MTEARFGQAFSQAAWPGALEGTGNYRPVTLSSFALEWSIWGESTFGFHAMSVLSHTLVSLLVLILMSRFFPLPGALIGAGLFAIHPIHTEAVANVMGRAELYAAMAYLGACLLYLRTVRPGGLERGARLGGILLLFLLAVGSKEIAVTLPGMVIALEVYRRSEAPLRERLRRELPTYIALFAAMACYVIVRWNALGDVTGESAAAGLVSLGTGERILTALTVWPHYLRLLVFPLDLASDYAPAVLVTTDTVNVDVVLGTLLLLGTVAGALLLRRNDPFLALGFAWFIVGISPVSNLIVRSDILLAERTLYLPSVALSLVAAAIATKVAAEATPHARRGLLVLSLVAGGLLLTRTVLRNPSWMNTYQALVTLTAEHPESWLAHRAQAIGLEGVGAMDEAGEAYERAIQIAPDHYQLLVDAAVFYNGVGRIERSEELLHQAIALLPRHPEAYRRLSEFRLRRGDGRAAHAIALLGLARVERDGDLWELVSESYVMKGDLAAAARARRASLGVRPTVRGWSRLAEIYEFMEDGENAAAARVEAARLSPPSGTGT